MRLQVDVVTGFLSAGKTRFIQNSFQNGLFNREKKTVIIQCEEGETAFSQDQKGLEEIIIYQVDEPEQLNEEFFKEVVRSDQPEQVIIEYNGTWELEHLLDIRLPRHYRIGTLYYLLNQETFSLYMNNMNDLLMRQIQDCDAVIVTGKAPVEDENRKVLEESIEQTIKNINRKAEILSIQDKELGNKLEKVSDEVQTDTLFHMLGGIGLILGIGCLYLYIDMLKITGRDYELQFLAHVRTCFFSILLDAFPFVIIGVLIASMLQIYISNDRLIRLLTKKKGIAYPLAIFSGVWLPICDCAMVPITSRMIKKGVPVSIAVTFMLAAPVVNPITITSTLYAFPERPFLCVIRVLTGILTALLTGLLLGFLTDKKEVGKERKVIQNSCSSGYLGEMYFKGKMGRLEAVIRHTGQELIRTGGYVMIGALISAVVQAKGLMKGNLGITNSIFVAGMTVIASVFLSICANSNAFVARAFLGQMPLSNVLAFMVMGPMLDIKNLLMMLGNYKKWFVGLYILCVLGISFIIFFAAGHMM